MKLVLFIMCFFDYNNSMVYSTISDALNINDKQLVFILVVSLVVVVSFFILVFFPIRRFINKTRFLFLFYKKVRSVAIDRDFYLINQFVFYTDEKNKDMIDHILFGNKFIYLIISQYYEGDLVGKQIDNSLVQVNKKGEKKYCDNPVERSRFLMSRLSMSTGVDTVMMIGIVMVNDNCKLQIESNSKQFYIIQRNKFPALIKAIESRKIGNINPTQLENLVKAIDKQNKKKR